MEKTFEKIKEENAWGSVETVSGIGSELRNTVTLREELKFVFSKYKIKSILDIPCGDFNWMNEVDLKDVEYTGADILDSLIESNKEKYPDYKFINSNIISDDLPSVDLILVRDMLGHLTNENVHATLDNIKKSGSKYLLTTTLTGWDFNSAPTEDGGWRPINLLIKPFSLRPIYLLNEDCVEGYPDYNDKCMVLFDLEKISIASLKPEGQPALGKHAVVNDDGVVELSATDVVIDEGNDTIGRPAPTVELAPENDGDLDWLAKT